MRPTLRAVLSLSAHFLFGALIIYHAGPITSGLILLISVPVLGFIVVGRSFSILAVITNFLFMCGIGVLLKNGLIRWNDYVAFPPGVWIVMIMNVVIFSSVFVFSISLIFKGFTKALSRIENTQTVTVLGLAKLSEYRDKDTGTHLDRIKKYTTTLAHYMSKLPAYQSYISPDYISSLSLSSVLHDIGKVAVPDSILMKPGKLSPDEFEQMKNHSLFGGRVLEDIEKQIQGRSYLSIGKQVAYSHHEKWDGSGYPHGLSNEKIPLSARIVAIADVYDALCSDRVYKKAMTHEDACRIIFEGAGTHFDPKLVDLFSECSDKFKAINEQSNLSQLPQ